MPRKKSIEVSLTSLDETTLERWNKGVNREAMRAEIVSRAARGETNYMIAKQLGISRNTVKKWRYRFAREGIEGLKSRPIPGRPKTMSAPPARVEAPSANLSTVTES